MAHSVIQMRDDNIAWLTAAWRFELCVDFVYCVITDSLHVMALWVVSCRPKITLFSSIDDAAAALACTYSEWNARKLKVHKQHVIPVYCVYLPFLVGYKRISIVLWRFKQQQKVELNHCCGDRSINLVSRGHCHPSTNDPLFNKSRFIMQFGWIWCWREVHNLDS